MYDRLSAIYLIIWYSGSVSSQREMNSRVRHQVCLEFIEIHIECTIKTKGGSDGRDNLGNDPIQVGVGWSLSVELLTAYVIYGLIVYHECTVRVLQGGMRGQDCLWKRNRQF